MIACNCSYWFRISKVPRAQPTDWWYPHAVRGQLKEMRLLHIILPVFSRLEISHLLTLIAVMWDESWAKLTNMFKTQKFQKSIFVVVIYTFKHFLIFEILLNHINLSLCVKNGRAVCLFILMAWGEAYYRSSRPGDCEDSGFHCLSLLTRT